MLISKINFMKLLFNVFRLGNDLLKVLNNDFDVILKNLHKRNIKKRKKEKFKRKQNTGKGSCE